MAPILPSHLRALATRGVRVHRTDDLVGRDQGRRPLQHRADVHGVLLRPRATEDLGQQGNLHNERSETFTLPPFYKR